MGQQKDIEKRQKEAEQVKDAKEKEELAHKVAKISKAYKPIADNLRCIDSSKTYSGYPIENMFADNSDYWCSQDAENVFLIFDCKNSKVSTWQMTMGYDCGKVTFSTSDKKNSIWNELKVSKPSEETDLETKNKRFVKLTFDEVDSGYVGITSLQIKGIKGAPMDDEEVKEEPAAEKKEEAVKSNNDKIDLEDENDDDFEADEASTNVTLNADIKIIDSFPKKDDLKAQFKKMITDQLYEYMELSDLTALSGGDEIDVSFTLDLDDTTIDTLEIGIFEAYHCQTIKVYTSASTNEDSFKLIKIKR